MFGDQPSTPPIPMVVCWDDLDPTTYPSLLSALADWITWFRATYRIPATVIAPCWFNHPGIREDIGHLWTGWQLTRHPDAGVGMIGLDWDQRKDATINRLREATAITGCTATRHQPEPEPARTRTNAIDKLWQDHLDSESQRRARVIARRAAEDSVVEILQAAELRHELAPVILADVTAEAATDDADQVGAVTERLVQRAVDAVERAATVSADAVNAVIEAHHHSEREANLADARDYFATSLASSTLNCDTSGPNPQELALGWLRALEHLLPARIAADRAAAAAAARTAAVDQRAIARRRHPNIDDLLQ
jgi:hypothetical protein